MNDLLDEERFTLLMESMNASQTPGWVHAKDTYDALRTNTIQGVRPQYALFLKKMGKKGNQRGTKSSSAVIFSKVARTKRGFLTFHSRKHKVEVLLSISIFWFIPIRPIFTDFWSLEKKAKF